MDASEDLDGDGLSDAFELAHPEQFDPLLAEPRLITQVVGRIVDEGGQPVTGAVVHLYEQPVQPVTTGADGQFSISLETHPGLQVLQARRTDGMQLLLGLATLETAAPGRVEAGSITLRPLPRPPASQVTAGRFNTLAIRSDGELWGWGANSWGELGMVNGPTPGMVTTGREWRAIVTNARGSGVCYGIRDDGSLWSWGDNWRVQLGVGTDLLASDIPVNVEPGSRWRSVATGGASTLAIRADGGLWSWGDNQYGQLGNLADIGRYPTPVETNAVWLAISEGTTHSLAVRADGSLWAWGENRYGKLGVGTITATNLPTRVGASTSWKAVAAGTYTSFGLQSDGSLWQWGRSLDLSQTYATSPERVGNSTGWLSIGCGEVHVVALKDDHSLWTWGFNDNGLLGNGLTGISLEPVQFGGETNWVQASAGMEHTAALRSDGSLWTWGANYTGQLGTGVATLERPLVQFGTNSNWKTASAGHEFSAALDADGALWTWGRNTAGQLGVGSTADRHLPVLVPRGSPWASVVCGSSHVLALGADGSLWAWGDNQYGQLGDGTNIPKKFPQRVGADTDWAQISAGFAYSLAIKKDGSLWSWGQNSGGQLGSGDTVSRNRPFQVAPGSFWSAVSAGTAHTLAISDSGSLYAWGANREGQIGDGTSGASKTRLTRIGNFNDWTSIAAGQRHSVGARASGITYVWGISAISVSAGIPPYDQKRPFRVTGVPSAIGFAAGANALGAGAPSTLLMGNDRSLWGWGDLYRAGGDLVDVPMMIQGESDWLGASASSSHMLLIRADGSLWIRGSPVKGLQGIMAAKVDGRWGR